MRRETRKAVHRCTARCRFSVDDHRDHAPRLRCPRATPPRRVRAIGTVAICDRATSWPAGNALRRLGVAWGPVNVMWNNTESRPTSAVPSPGAVLHASNIRLFPEQIVCHQRAEDRVILDLPANNRLLAPVLPKLTPCIP